MLKRRAESKKKKTSATNIKQHKFGIANHSDKLLFKLTGGFLSPKPSAYNPNTSTQIAKASKSGTVTPSNKIRKQSK